MPAHVVVELLRTQYLPQLHYRTIGSNSLVYPISMCLMPLLEYLSVLVDFTVRGRHCCYGEALRRGGRVLNNAVVVN